MSKKSLLTLLSTAALSAVAALSVPMAASVAGPIAEARPTAKSPYTNKVYLVRLSELPVVAYDGSIKGYPATRPRPGQKINPNSPAVVNYKGYLEGRQDAVLAKVGGGRKLYSYGYVINGFAAELTAAQAARLRSTPGVLSVEKDVAMELDTSSTPQFIGVDGDDGVWATTGARGENVIIGIVDGGVWPEHPSLSDRTDVNGNATKEGKLGYQQIPGWHGRCVPGEAFTASNCNQKLIGARYYNEGWEGNAGIDEQLPYEYNSPRDYGGHGTHTATTAGGNAGVQATGLAAALGKVSGIAPRARIAAYKVCWQTATGGSCYSSDSLAAIDQAVADGVDVINFSISGSRTSFLDSVEVAFLFAADAGVFVATSAGNSGPGSSTVAHGGPWLTTVANGTHNRTGVGSVTLGNGMTINGASFANATPELPLVRSKDAGLPGVDAAKLALCFGTTDGPGDTLPHDNTPLLDPAKVAGKIVVCERGSNVLVNKSQNVMNAGGAGMVLLNTPTSVATQLAILHVVPTVHVGPGAGNADYTAIDGYAATPGATATINQSQPVFNVPAPTTASSSSRGPLQAGGGDLLKPDVMAPGTDILAGVAPPGNSGKLFDLYSGTSMSSPHVAGLAALFKELYPSWSPMMIKSAIMTTGYDARDPNVSMATLIFRQGAGQVDPKKAVHPGAVYKHGFNDWLAFLCGATTGVNPSTCTALRNAGYSTEPSNLNVPSIAIGDMLVAQTVKRRLTNVSGKKLTLTASVTGMGGFAVAHPPSLTLNPGETVPFEITFTRATAALNAYTGGQLTWSGDGYVIRSPIVVRPVALVAPAAVSSDGSPISYSVTFGYQGPFTATARGLVAPMVTAGTVDDDPTDSDCSLTSPNAQLMPVTIPAGTTYARYGTFDADVNAGSDLDLCVFQGTTLVGSSTTATSEEAVNLSFTNPSAAPIALTVVVQGWGVAGSTPFKLHEWYVGTAAAGNMSVSAPATATPNGTGTIDLSFSGLASGTRYLGSVAYGGVTGLPGPTIVSVNVP
ncbi:MAG TPA: S8 family serine peptidase [Steroidobacteraceae bacterium]|nr:S8 family serine peptidase [Steroidobacteraceae bacterium]